MNISSRFCEQCLKLSAFAVQTLVDAGKLDLKSLDLHRTKEYETKTTITDPITGGVSAVFWTVTHFYEGIVHLFTSPKEGIIETSTAIPKGMLKITGSANSHSHFLVTGVVKIVSSVHKGFVNLPQLYGTEVRQSGPVTSFSSGLKEAGKGLYYRRRGFLVPIKGSPRSFINATMLPAAGIVGAVKHPMKGAIKSVQALINKDKEGVQFNTRVSDGIEAVKFSTQSER
ncbi:hypothetical protein MPER_04820, partial [Moniliophthora perniciosa FA553]